MNTIGPGDTEVSTDDAALLLHPAAKAFYGTTDSCELKDPISHQGEAINELSEPIIESIPVCLKNLLFIAAPGAVTVAFTFCTSIIPLAMVGKFLGKDDLSGGSVGFFLLCILFQYPMIGLCYAVDTLCSHEFGRHTHSPRLGLIVQRSILVNLLLLLPVAGLIYCLPPFLHLVYGPVIGKLAMEFLQFSPVYLVPLLCLIPLCKFLNNQEKAYIPTVALSVGVLVTPLIQYELTPKGLKYTMIGMAITTLIQLLVVVGITVSLFETRQSFALGKWNLHQIFDKEEMKSYLRFGLSSVCFVAFEASGLDLAILLVASYGPSQGAAFSSVMNMCFMFAAVTGGISISACANIGRCIGAQAPHNARQYIKLALIATATCAIIDDVLIYFFFDNFLSLFGISGETLLHARGLRKIIFFLHIVDTLQYVFQGIFSGMGKNDLGARILIGCMWGVGIPLCFLLGSFFHWEGKGVAIGLAIGIFFEAPIMIYYSLFAINFEQLCLEHKLHRT